VDHLADGIADLFEHASDAGHVPGKTRSTRVWLGDHDMSRVVDPYRHDPCKFMDLFKKATGSG
jgi:hypothetical protein